MQNKYLIAILSLLLVIPTFAVQAANEVTLQTDTTIDLSTPNISVVPIATSTMDSITVNPSAGTIEITVSDGSDVQLKTTSRNQISFSSDGNEVPLDYITITCGANDSRIVANGFSGVSNSKFTITFSSDTCSSDSDTTATGSSGTVSTGGGGGGSSSSPSSTSTVTPTTTDTTTITDDTSDSTSTTDSATATETTVAQKAVSATPGVAAVDNKGKATLGQMSSDAAAVATGDVAQVIAKMGVVRNASQEAGFNSTIVASIVAGSGITAEVRNTITSFVTYGTPATGVLGAGERAGVVDSYKSAFGKLPTTSAEWNDVIKIANGRWPDARNEAKEDTAIISFRTIYQRAPDRNNPNDDAAVTVMAYGLRPANRNLDSEKVAIKSFEAIFGKSPSSASNWDAVRAIAYSGSTR